MKDCPCGTGFPYTDCCGPLIRGVGRADTAEDLMRSRFTALSLDHLDYLKSSLNPDEQVAFRVEEKKKGDIRWTRLEILEAKKGGAFDKEGEVTFRAHFTQNSESKSHQEISRFLKVNGRWYYSQRSSEVISKTFASSVKPFQRKRPKIGRNEPCPCGSGKKYKKCCGT